MSGDWERFRRVTWQIGERQFGGNWSRHKMFNHLIQSFENLSKSDFDFIEARFVVFLFYLFLYFRDSLTSWLKLEIFERKKLCRRETTLPIRRFS